MSFFEELKRRNVAKVAVLYVVFAWLLLQVTDVLSSLLPVPEWAGSLVVMLLILGFFPVMVFSWIYELTPEGIKREKDVDRSQSITGDTGRKINVLIIVMLALAIGTVVLDRFMPRHAPSVVAEGRIADQAEETPAGVPEEEPRVADPTAMAGSKFAPAPDRSIAVLPFADMSPDKDQEYFSDGLSEELLNLLAKIPELRVASRTSAFSYKGKDVRIAEVAEQLNVAHVLEGSIRKSGNRVRITAQLIDADEDVHLWSETWDRTLDDVFAIQDEIASNVVDQLKVTLLGAPPEQAETSPEAYNLYLQARHVARQGSGQSMLRSLEMFDEVLAIDPEYVPAMIGKGTAYTNLAGSGVMDDDEGYELARQFTRQALDLDPDNARALSQLGWYYANYAGDYDEAARLYTRALALGPNEDKVLNAVAVFLKSLGRLEDSVEIYKRLLERDPVNHTPYFNLGVVYLSLRDYDAAQAAIDKALQITPDMLLARIYRGVLFYLQGDPQGYLDAFATLSDETKDEVFRLLSEASVYPEIGRAVEGEQSLRQLEEQYGDSWTYVIATVHADQGRHDVAFEWLERAYRIGGRSELSGAQWDPFLDPLHDDPRWQPLLEKTGISSEQLAAVDFEYELPR
jgi:TolB-like protein/Tfp pilus assembly protein PilF